MDKLLAGLHHVTAIAGDPQTNVDFYTSVLGLRLVKRTVNFDDPNTYHLYYGNYEAAPGTILTFFTWPGAAQGRRGRGQATALAFAIGKASVPFWSKRLRHASVVVEKPFLRFGEKVIRFYDPDGLQVELVACGDENAAVEQGATDPHAIIGFHSVTITEGSESTPSFLIKAMGFRLLAREKERSRFVSGKGAPGKILDVVVSPSEEFGAISVGTVHHLAWRVPDSETQKAWREQLIRFASVTRTIDRKYFESIYFREPGGTLFEMATDAPGFTVDEPMDRLGSGLMLPRWFEKHRHSIEESLPPIKVPAQKRAA
jgi:glyoxalase family protein